MHANRVEILSVFTLRKCGHLEGLDGPVLRGLGCPRTSARLIPALITCLRGLQEFKWIPCISLGVVLAVDPMIFVRGPQDSNGTTVVGCILQGGAPWDFKGMTCIFRVGGSGLN